MGHYVAENDVSPAAVRRLVHALLEEPTYRAAARRIGDEIARMPSPAEAVSALECVATSRA